jgi:hypothetical protein
MSAFSDFTKFEMGWNTKNFCTRRVAVRRMQKETALVM